MLSALRSMFFKVVRVRQGPMKNGRQDVVNFSEERLRGKMLTDQPIIYLYENDSAPSCQVRPIQDHSRTSEVSAATA